MTPNDFEWRRGAAHVAEVERLAALAEAEGAEYGPLLLQHPPRTWRRHMRANPHYRSYGTLKFLIDNAVQRMDTEPTRAYEITAAVLDFVDEVSAPVMRSCIGAATSAAIPS